MKQASSSSPKVQSKKWLREASMNRLSTFMKNKTELIGNAAQLGMGVIAVDDLEKSGLSPTEIFHLEQWVAGVETGRHCMLAILDERFNDKDVESASSSSSSTFQPIELIKTSMNLPQDFLCDSGFVYETVFKRPPTSVIREALQMLSSKAFEKSAQGLNAHQINIAIKQLRIDYLADDRFDPSKAASDDVEDGNDENVSHNTPRDSSDTKTSTEASTPVAKASEHTFKLQVMIELIRMHIIANNAKLKADQRSSSSAASRSSTSAAKDNWNPAISSDSESVSDAYVSDGADSEDSQDSLDELFDDLPEFIQKGLRSSKPSKSRKTRKSKKPVDTRKSLFSKSSNATAEMKTQFARDLVNKRTTDNDESSTAGAAASAERIDIRTLEYHLNTPLQSVQEQAASLTNEDIEYSNQLLKPYLKKLASLKTVLTTQLKDLQESRAYLCLGVTPDASDEAIKKAYRLMAIKLHPDKAGGSTVKFQQLQDHYHEILKRRQNNKTERRAFSEVRKQEKSQQKQKTAAFRAAKGLDPEQEEDELNTEDEELMSGEKKKKTGLNRNRASSEDVGSDSESEEEEEKNSKTDAKNKSEDSAAPSSSSSKKQSSKTVESDAEEEEDVEDVHISDHEDDEEIDPVTGETKRDQRAKAAAAEKAASQNSEYIKNKKRGLKKQIKEGSYSSFTEFAQAIADSILELLVTIKQSAGDITTLAQYNIKLHKAVLTISTTQAHPVSIREIMKLMKSTALSATLGTPVGEAQVTSDLCSLTNAVGPIELICELCQSICSSAMRLSSECGVHYAKQVATNRSFLATVEETMNNSLKSLKMVMQCMSSQDQFYTALRRVQDSFQLSLESEEISDLLIEMLTTALQSNVLTITNTVDRIVETSLNVSNVYELVLDTIRETEHQIQQQVRREASQRETEEAEEDFCEEDKELLRQSRANQRQQQQQKEKEQSEQQQQKAENKKAEKKSDEEEDEDENSLTNLKDKIRALQIQLRIQHISTLQNMNKDILGLQSNIISEIKDLPFIQSWEALFKTPTGSKEKKPQQQADKNASSGDFHTSIMTLLSTLLDSSCLAIRDELKAASDLTSGHFCLRSDSHFRGVIIKHLGWTSIVLSDGTKDLLSSHILNRLFSAEASSASSPPEAASSSSGAAPSSASFKARLALYPEYKTKILYMASVVDVDTVKDIIGTELFQRLDELLFEANGQKRLSQTSAPASSPSSPSVKNSTAAEASETASQAAVEEKCAAPVPEKKSQSLDESFDIDCTVADVGPEATSETLFDDVDGEIFSSYVSPSTKSTASGGFVHITSEQAFNAAEADEVDEEERDITGNDDSEAEDATSSYADVQQPESPVSAEDSYEAPDTEVEEAFSEEERERPLAASAAMAAEDEEEFGASLGDREADEVPAMYSYYQQKARSSERV